MTAQAELSCRGSDLIFTALHAGMSGSSITEEMIQNCGRKICEQPKPAWVDAKTDSTLKCEQNLVRWDGWQSRPVCEAGAVCRPAFSPAALSMWGGHIISVARVSITSCPKTPVSVSQRASRFSQSTVWFSSAVVPRSHVDECGSDCGFMSWQTAAWL